MDTSDRLIVVGARPGSLGEAIAIEARLNGLRVVTAGISGEDQFFDIFQPMDIAEQESLAGCHVVCTAGINTPGAVTEKEMEGSSMYAALLESLQVNTMGPLLMLQHWFRQNSSVGGRYCHFVGITSNSAQVARSGSLPYCVSKAALSMGLRSSARDVSKLTQRLSVYEVQTGWLLGTPMSDEVVERLAPTDDAKTHVKLHRMLTPSIDPRFVARMIVQCLVAGDNTNLNGCTLRVDGGEQ